MDRVTLSYPGTPTKSYGYSQHSNHHQHLTSSTIGYGHPSVRYSPDPMIHHGTWSLGSHRQALSTYSDRHYPTSSSSSVSHNPYLGYSQRDILRSGSPSNLTRRNFPIHSSSSSSSIPRSTNVYHHRRSPEPYANKLASNSNTAGGDASLREQIKNGLRYFADERKRLYADSLLQQSLQHHHSDNDLRYINQLPGYPGIGTGYGQRPLNHNPYPTRRHHRSESDLEALFNLYSNPPDPVAERRPQPGVSRVGGIPLEDMSPVMNSPYYIQRNASYPSIPLPGQMTGPFYPHPGPGPVSGPGPGPGYQQASHYIQQYHDPYQQSLPEHLRYARSNPHMAYPHYGSSPNTRYSRSVDRYY